MHRITLISKISKVFGFKGLMANKAYQELTDILDAQQVDITNNVLLGQALEEQDYLNERIDYYKAMHPHHKEVIRELRGLLSRKENHIEQLTNRGD